MGQRMSNELIGALSGDMMLDEQYAVISEVVARALQELQDTAGPDQQITTISVDLDDGTEGWNGNVLPIAFTAEVSTRLR